MKHVIAFVGASLVGQAALAQSEILVSDQHGHKVVRFDWVTTLPIDHFVGAGVSELNNAVGMAFDAGASLYVASHNTHSVQKYSGVTGQPLGAFVAPGVGGLNGPIDLTFGPDGDLYVTSHGDGSIRRYDGMTGQPDPNPFVAPGAGGLSGPHSLAFGADDDLYVASFNSDEVKRYDGATGLFVENVVGPGDVVIDGPVGVVFDDDGSLYVTSRLTSSIIKVDTSGDASTIVNSGVGGLSEPNGLTISPDGTLLVVSSGGNGAVKEFTPNGVFLGNFISEFAGGLGPDPVYLVVKPDVEICEADANDDGVLNILDFVTFQLQFQEGCDD